MDAFIDALNHPLWIIIEAIIACLLSYWLFIKRWPLNKRQWKVVEGIWVSVAFFSVIGLVEENRTARAALVAEQTRQEAFTALQDIDVWLSSWSTFACEDKTEMAPYLPVCKWTRQKQADFAIIIGNEPLPEGIAVGMAAGIEQAFKGLDQSDRAIYEARLDHYMTTRVRLSEAQELAAGNSFFMRIVPLAPLILTLLVALKLTMIIAEWRTLGPSKPPKK